jgi:hypothetical protein
MGTMIDVSPGAEDKEGFSHHRVFSIVCAHELPTLVTCPGMIG